MIVVVVVVVVVAAVVIVVVEVVVVTVVVVVVVAAAAVVVVVVVVNVKLCDNIIYCRRRLEYIDDFSSIRVCLRFVMSFLYALFLL